MERPKVAVDHVEKVKKVLKICAQERPVEELKDRVQAGMDPKPPKPDTRMLALVQQQKRKRQPGKKG